MVDLSFNQLLIWLIQKEGSEVFFGGKMGPDTVCLRQKRGRYFFCESKLGAITFFSQMKRERRVFSFTKNPENTARVPRKFWFVPKSWRGSESDSDPC